MKSRKIAFQVRRYKPGVIDPARFQAFEIDTHSGMTVLDALAVIRLEQDGSLVYRHSCHHASCGTCAMVINGEPRLACMTRLDALGATAVRLEPLAGFQPVADLAVDVRPFFARIPAEWRYLRADEPRGAESQPPTDSQPLRFEDCIECGLCVAACPVTGAKAPFAGPAMLAALHNEMIKSPLKKAALLARAGEPDGVAACRRAAACSRVCPTGVNPARHIADLRRLLVSRPGRSGRREN